MNVLYTVDNNFVPQLAASICSICKNNTAMQSITFYVLADSVSSENKAELEQFAMSEGRSINIIDVSGFMDSFGDEFDTLGWNEVIMARLLMARFLPDTIERILYLDGDTIVRGPLDDLWKMDLHGNVLAAAMEPTVDGERRAILGLKDLPYCNSGVLLVDLKEWRAQKAEKRILDYCVEHKDTLFAPDQDAINAVLVNSISILPPKYNYCNVMGIYPYKMMKKLMECYVDSDAYDEARKDPCIIHYLGEERPWRDGNEHEYREDYFRYLRLTPWKDAPLEQGWKTYFIAWRAFNAMMKFTPFLRYRIINGLIPVFMKARKKMRER